MVTKSVLEFYKTLYSQCDLEKLACEHKIELIEDCTFTQWHLQQILSTQPDSCIIVFHNCLFKGVDLMSVLINVHNILPFFNCCRFEKCKADACANKYDVPKSIVEFAIPYMLDDSVRFNEVQLYIRKEIINTSLGEHDVPLGVLLYLADKNVFSGQLDSSIVIKEDNLLDSSNEQAVEVDELKMNARKAPDSYFESSQWRIEDRE